MKRICVALIGIALMWSLPPITSAQGFLGSAMTPGPGELPVRWSSSAFDTCDRPGAGILGMPRVYFGWLEHAKGTRWASRFELEQSTGTAQWPLKGWWFGVCEDLTLLDGVGLVLSGSIFLPQRSAGAWFTSPLTETFDFEVPSYDWWSADGLARKRVSGPVALLAGFRFDHTSTRVNYRDNTLDDYILNIYLPLVGLQIDQIFSTGSLLVRFVGTPVMYGMLRYEYWDQEGYAEFADFRMSSGCFGEIFAEYSRKLPGDLFVGGFVRWNSLSLKTASHNLSGGSTDPVLWTVRIQSWTVGGSLSLPFSSPF